MIRLGLLEKGKRKRFTQLALLGSWGGRSKISRTRTKPRDSVGIYAVVFVTTRIFICRTAHTTTPTYIRQIAPTGPQFAATHFQPPKPKSTKRQLFSKIVGTFSKCLHDITKILPAHSAQTLCSTSDPSPKTTSCPHTRPYWRRKKSGDNCFSSSSGDRPATTRTAEPRSADEAVSSAAVSTSSATVPTESLV